MATGIEPRHGRRCRSRDGGDCNCKPTYQAQVYDSRAKKAIKRTFPSFAAARNWRADQLVALREGRLRHGGHGPTLNDAARAWLDGARAGQVRNRSGDPYKPAAVRDYERNLRLRVLPEFGDRRLGEIRRVELQRFVDDLVSAGLSASTIVTTLLPLRAIYRRAVARGEVDGNPTRGLEMPAVRRTIRYVTAPAEAERLLDALEGEDRVLWATAIYAGLRRGELAALRWEDVDLAQGVIHVRRGWDVVEGEIAPKSREGRRKVPIPGPLRDALVEHRMGVPDGQVRVFRSAPWVIKAGPRAVRRWDKAKLSPITLHEGRHTYASFMIAAGVNAKALAAFMGHANIAVTYDLYGHLFPGSEAEAAGLLETFLSRGRAAGTDATVAQTVAQTTESEA